MFGRKPPQKGESGTCGADISPVSRGEHIVTVIGRGSAVEGNITAGKGTEVYGLFTGDISLQEGAARVMPGGRVNGNIRATEIEIGGRVEGRCEGQSVTVLEQGVLKGMCCSAEFSIRAGGVFTGTSEAWPETVVAVIPVPPLPEETEETLPDDPV